MTISVFDSTSDDSASDAFIAWRRAHRRDGFYLNESSKYGWVLHRADCGHAVVPSDFDLAGRVKVCNSATRPLRAWLEDRGAGPPHRCDTCRPPVLPSKVAE